MVVKIGYMAVQAILTVQV